MTRKKKIIFINSRYYGRKFPDQTDNSFYLFGAGSFIAKELINYDDSILVENWRADSTIDKDMAKKIDGIFCRIFKGTNIPFLGTFSFSMLKNLHKQIKSDKYFLIVHFHGLHNIGFDIISWLIPKTPIVATHHGGGNFLFKYSKSKKLISFLAEKFDRMSLKQRIDHFFVQTDTEYNYLASFKNKANISKFTPFGFDFNIFKPMNKNEARLHLSIPTEKTIILSIGRADHLKGVEHVVKVFNELKREIPELILLCVDIDPSDLYFNTVKDSGAIIVGKVAYHDLPIYYSAADVLVYLPFDDESLNFAGPGYITAEALACGIPVVSSLLIHFWDDSIKKVAKIPKSLEDVRPMVRDILKNPPDPEQCRTISFNYYNWNYVIRKHNQTYDKLFNSYFDISIAHKEFDKK